MKNIHPVFDRMLPRNLREAHLKQRSKALWFTGLSGSGKTTLAIALEWKLFQEGFFAQVIDGDNVRTGLNAGLGFSEEDRKENIRRIAELTKLYVQSGVIVLNCFISPTIAIRKMAREIIGEEDFIEIYVNTPLEICEKRDVKGLYEKARRGEIENFTGISAPYEPPENPDIEIRTEHRSKEDCLKELWDKIHPSVRWKE